VELISPDYNCAARNNITFEEVELPTVKIHLDKQRGVNILVYSNTLTTSGWMQCAALPSLPKGLNFTDDGHIVGNIEFDERREQAYDVDFFAFNTRLWDWNSTESRRDEGQEQEQEILGKIVKVVISFSVTGNIDTSSGTHSYRPPGAVAFKKQKEQEATKAARAALSRAYSAYQGWEKKHLEHGQCVDEMLSKLADAKAILDEWPLIENGMLWVWLGGLHMNVHKMMANVLIDCELYLGQALLFPSEEVKDMALENLEGCYAKRTLEAAKFLWLEGLQLVVDGKWREARGVLRTAAAKKDGWGWGVNNGDIWITLGAVRLVEGTQAVLANWERPPLAPIHLRSAANNHSANSFDRSANSSFSANNSANAATSGSAGSRQQHRTGTVLTSCEQGQDYQKQGRAWQFLDDAEKVLKLAQDRSPEHPWTQYNLEVVSTLRSVVRRGGGGPFEEEGESEGVADSKALSPSPTSEGEGGSGAALSSDGAAGVPTPTAMTARTDPGTDPSSTCADHGEEIGLPGLHGSGGRPRSKSKAELTGVLSELEKETASWSARILGYVQPNPRPRNMPYPPQMPWDGAISWGLQAQAANSGS
jgi:hypothetical protein